MFIKTVLMQECFRELTKTTDDHKLFRIAYEKQLMVI